METKNILKGELTPANQKLTGALCTSGKILGSLTSVTNSTNK